MLSQKNKEFLGLKDITCPKCESDNIMSQRGEIASEEYSIHECKCNDCECNFLVTSYLQQK